MAELDDILARLRLHPSDVTSAAAAVRGQQDLLLARVSALTEAIRKEGGSAAKGPPLRTEDERVAARLLLADLGLVVSHLRGQANELGASLDAALRSLRSAVSQ